MCPIDPAACLVLADDARPALTEAEWRRVTEAQLLAIAALLALACAAGLVLAA